MISNQIEEEKSREEFANSSRLLELTNFPAEPCNSYDANLFAVRETDLSASRACVT